MSGWGHGGVVGREEGRQGLGKWEGEGEAAEGAGEGRRGCGAHS